MVSRPTLPPPRCFAKPLRGREHKQIARVVFIAPRLPPVLLGRVADGAIATLTPTRPDSGKAGSERWWTPGPRGQRVRPRGSRDG